MTQLIFLVALGATDSQNVMAPSKIGWPRATKAETITRTSRLVRVVSPRQRQFLIVG